MHIECFQSKMKNHWLPFIVQSSVCLRNWCWLMVVLPIPHCNIGLDCGVIKSGHILEVFVMSLHLALPRRDHLEQFLHIFAHLKNFTIMNWYITQVTQLLVSYSLEWETGYLMSWAYCEKRVSTTIYVIFGFSFVIGVMTDAYLASSAVPRRLRIGFLVFGYYTLVHCNYQ